MGSVEIHTPRTITFFSGHLKLDSGRIFSFFAVIDPIHKACIFLSLSLRPETMPKLLIIARAVDRDLRVPFRIKVVSSAHWLCY